MLRDVKMVINISAGLMRYKNCLARNLLLFSKDCVALVDGCKMIESSRVGQSCSD